MNEPLYNKRLKIFPYVDIVRGGCNYDTPQSPIGHYFTDEDVKSAIEWMKKEIKESYPILLSISKNRNCLTKIIEKAFPDLYKK